MSLVAVLVVVAIVAVAVVIGLALRSRTSDDGVASFQRQIDALSPEARRPTVDQVRSVDPTPQPRVEPDADGSASDDSSDDAEGA